MRCLVCLAMVLSATTLVACEGESSAPPPETCDPSPACTKVESVCLALVDNGGSDRPGLRVSQITVTKPALLSTGVVAETVAGDVLLDSPACHLSGKGTFTWLIEFDRPSGTVRTGGAAPSTPEAGYCFLQGLLDGANVAPVAVPATADSGSFAISIPALTIPIYLDATGQSFVLLPLRSVAVTGTITPDLNCIGAYNGSELDPRFQCQGNETQPTFKNGGSMEAIITLEDADAVVVTAARKSLCVLLSGNASMFGDGGSPVERCKRDATGKIVFLGDWCSTTQSPDGCRDSAALGAEFAASAVSISELPCP